MISNYCIFPHRNSTTFRSHKFIKGSARLSQQSNCKQLGQLGLNSEGTQLLVIGTEPPMAVSPCSSWNNIFLWLTTCFQIIIYSHIITYAPYSALHNFYICTCMDTNRNSTEFCMCEREQDRSSTVIKKRKNVWYSNWWIISNMHNTD